MASDQGRDEQGVRGIYLSLSGFTHAALHLDPSSFLTLTNISTSPSTNDIAKHSKMQLTTVHYDGTEVAHYPTTFFVYLPSDNILITTSKSSGL